MISNYFKTIGARRIVVMLIGNVFIGMGVALFKLSGMGNDPFSGMMMALSARLGMSYPLFQVLMNLLFFIAQILWGRHLIGAGTIVNAVLLGYLADFFYRILILLTPPPALFVLQVLLVFVGVIICSFGLSLYQQSDVGVAPYDSLSLMLHERCRKISYFWCRIFTDALAAATCWLAGGIVGLGTLVSAFGLGPFIQFFNVHFTRRILPESQPATEKGGSQ